MDPEQGFEFVPLTDADLPLLSIWLARPHVAQWWGPAEQELPKIEKALRLPDIDPYRVDHRGEPIAYLQCYRIGAESPAALRDQPPGTRGIDLFIGHADCLDKGVGSAMIRVFVTRLFAEGDTGRVIIDPDPANRRAIRAYEKAGFHYLDTLDLGWGPAYLMACEPPGV